MVWARPWNPLENTLPAAPLSLKDPRKPRPIFRRLTAWSGATALVLLALALLADSHTVQVLGPHLAALRPEGRAVVLSFDDGPNPASTVAILAVLRDRGVPATFFLIGERIDRHPDLARRIVWEGHQVGNHTYSHPRMVLEHPHAYAREIDRTDQRIRALGYCGTIDFRPPYGQKLVVLPWLLARRHKLSVLWSVDSRDWVDRDPASIARRVQREVRPGSIVLLHDQPRTARALPAIIDGLRRRGYRFRTVRTDHTKPTDHTNRTAHAAHPMPALALNRPLRNGAPGSDGRNAAEPGAAAQPCLEGAPP